MMRNQSVSARFSLARTAQLSPGPVAGRQSYWFFIHYLTSRHETNGPTEEIESAPPGEDEAIRLRRLEAALFLAREGLTSRKLAKIAGLADATEARTLIRRLNQKYDEEGRAFKVEEIASGYALLSRSRFATWLRRLPHVPGERRLSQSALETLAIVAYRQPVLRADVEAIRGVSCSEVLKQLMDLELVRISGRSEDLGRPYLYGTTRRFLQMFGLRSADRLPRMAWVNELQMALSSNEIADTDEEVKESTVTKSFSTAAILEEELRTDIRIAQKSTLVSSSEDDDEYFEEEEEDDDFDDDEEDDVDDDEVWDDDEDEEDVKGDVSEDDEEEDDEDLEEESEESEWEEVDDDDDGWDDEEDEEEDDDDDWEDDDDEDEWD